VSLYHESACDDDGGSGSDSLLDENMTTPFSRDADGDGYGDPTFTVLGCPGAPPSGYVTNSADCDDASNAINPGIHDTTVDGIDQNCDGTDGPVIQTSYVYFPAIKDGPHTDGQWANWLSIQAKDRSQPVDLTFKLYNSDGTLKATVIRTAPINGGVTITPNKLMFNVLNREAFDGTVIVEALVPILGMTNTISPSEQAYDTYEAPTPRANLFFPAAYDNYVTATRTGYQNLIHLQNISANPVNITVLYKDDWNGTVTDTYTIPGYGEYERNIRTVFGGNFNGTISVSASAPLAGMLRYEYLANNVVKSTTMYEATVDRTEIYYPYIYDGYGGNSNWYAFLNTSTQPVTCTINFYENTGDTGTGPAFTKAITINAGARYTKTPSKERYNDFTHSFTGSMTGSCTGTVTSIMNVITPNAEGYNDYEATVPKPTLVLPQVYDNVLGWVNEVHLQNTNPFPVTVNLDVIYTTGQLLGSQTQTIGPYAKYIVRPYTLNTQIATFETNGSMKVTVAGGNAISSVMVFKKTAFVSVYEAVAP